MIKILDCYEDKVLFKEITNEFEVGIKKIGNSYPNFNPPAFARYDDVKCCIFLSLPLPDVENDVNTEIYRLLTHLKHKIPQP